MLDTASRFPQRWRRRPERSRTARQTCVRTHSPVSPGFANGNPAVLYARVSLADQRADLDRQKLRLLEHAQKQDMQVDEVIGEVGSGLNGCGRKLLAALSRPGPGVVVVEHRDRLVWPGSASRWWMRCCVLGAAG